jgi:hypothetical protein
MPALPGFKGIEQGSWPAAASPEPPLVRSPGVGLPRHRPKCGCVPDEPQRRPAADLGQLAVPRGDFPLAPVAKPPNLGRDVSTIDLVKLALVVPIFFIAGPLGGVLMKGKPAAQRWVFALMCFMTINGLMAAGNWGLTIASIETYRGHTKGFHFYFNHALAIALIVANRLENRKEFRWLVPGLCFYLLYCAVSLLSIANAPRKDLALMAAHKMIFASLILVAAYNYLKTEADLQFFLQVMAVTILWEFVIVLKMKYLQGVYQVRGTFEHQNPLAMYCVLIGMVFLATGLGPPFKRANLVLFGFMATAAIVQCTLSRAALAMFGAGTIGVLGLSVVEKPTARRLTTTAMLGFVGAVGLLLTLDTIISRFNDQGNQASSELRHVMNAASKAMAHDRSFGIGWNNYALVVNPPFPYADVYYEWIRGRGMKVDETRANAVVESHYYLLLGETGYPGLACYLLMILVGLWRNFRAFVAFGHSFLRCLALGIAAGTALNYVQSTLERVLVQPRNLMLWMLLFAVTGRLHTLRRQMKNRSMPAASTQQSLVP